MVWAPPVGGHIAVQSESWAISRLEWEQGQFEQNATAECEQDRGPTMEQ